MTIQNICINEFKGIKKLEEPLKLNRFNILIGKNNVGKTSLLQALYLYPHGELADEIYGTSKIKFLNSLWSSPEAVHYKYAGKSVIDYTTKPPSSSKASEKFTITLAEKKMGVICNGRSFRPENAHHYKLPLYFPYDTLNSETHDKYLESHENEVVKSGSHTSTAERLSKYVDDNYTEIIRKEDGWHLRRDDASYPHINDLGSGLQKFIRSMLIAENVNPKILLWDDFDASAHPALIRLVLKWLYDHKDWQILLTTHSIDVLYALLDFEPADDISIINVSKSKKDILSFKYITLSELDTMIDSNVDPRLLYENMDM